MKKSTRRVYLCGLAFLAIGLAVWWFFTARSESGASTLAAHPRLIRLGTDSPGRDPGTKPPEPPLSTDINDGLWGPVPVDPAHPRLTFQMLGMDRKLTSQAIEYAGISKDKLMPVQKCIDDLMTNMEVLVRGHAKVDPLRDSPEAGISAFIIPPFPAEGAAARKDFSRRLESEVGPEAASKLIESFGWINYYGACGQQEVLAQFSEVQTANGGRMAAKWELRHPTTGKLMSSTFGDYEAWTRVFGSALEITPEVSQVEGP